MNALNSSLSQDHIWKNYSRILHNIDPKFHTEFQLLLNTIY